MPGLLTPPTGRPTTVTITDTTVIRTDTVIGAGTVLFGDALPLREFDTSMHNGSMAVYIDRDYYSTLPPWTLTNYGVIWNYQPSTDPNRLGLADYGVVSVGGAVTNHGTIAVENYSGVSYAVYAQGHSANSGWIYANTVNGVAFGYVSEDHLGSLSNSGVVAVHSGTGSATGVVMDNGGYLLNSANGIIQVSGAYATGVVFNRGFFPAGSTSTAPQIENAGLIEVISTDPDSASVGIYVEHLEVERMEIVNSGTISADIAILGSSTSFSPLQHSVERIVNTATGQILGDIITTEGDDVLINQGTIRGTVLLGDDNDLFDNRGGLLDGYADLGFGNDRLHGSDNTDYVRGESGDDVLEGNGGNDLLIGDWGSDVLIGGSGNDGLYGESGNDRIVTQGGDFVAAGTGNDRIEIGDYSFARIDGEGDVDTLVLAGTGRTLNLGAALQTGRICGIEIVELGSSDGLVVSAEDVATITGGQNTLTVTGADNASLHLIGSWTASGSEIIGGVEYALYTNGTVRVLVDGGPNVAIATTAPAGAVGLDAVSAGPAALQAGAISGMERYSGDTFANFFRVSTDLVISEDETWFSENGNTVLSVSDLSRPDLTNFGNVLSISGPVPGENTGIIGYVNADMINLGLRDGPSLAGSLAIYSFIGGVIANNGLVVSETSQAGTSVAIAVSQHGRVVNDGDLFSLAADGIAVGVWTYDGTLTILDGAYAVSNTGNFSVRSDGNHAIGVYSGNAVSIYNNGYLEVSGATGAWGIVGSAGGTIVNDGTFVVNTTDENGSASVAYHLWMTMAQSIVNNGTIIADELAQNWSEGFYYEPIYLTNTGRIAAEINLWQGSDRISNSGLIEGNISLGLGRDRYENLGGTVTGLIDAGEGDDTATYQGNFADYLVHEGAAGIFTVSGQFGQDAISDFETLVFADLTVLVDTGSGISVDPNTADPDTFMLNIRDFDGNDLGGAAGWSLIGRADANGDGSGEYIYVNRVIGRFAEVGVGADGLLHFDNHSWGGDTRVVGIYIDPLVASGQVQAGGDHDSQRRFQNDLFIGNIARVLGADDYDGDGLQEIYFALTDGTAYLHAYMHADGNIRYANYQSQAQVIEFLNANGFGAETYGSWFTPAGQANAGKGADALHVPAWAFENASDMQVDWSGLAAQPEDLGAVAQFY